MTPSRTPGRTVGEVRRAPSRPSASTERRTACTCRQGTSRFDATGLGPHSSPWPALWDAVKGFGSSACDEEIHAQHVATILKGEALRLDEAPEGSAVVEPDH